MKSPSEQITVCPLQARAREEEEDEEEAALEERGCALIPPRALAAAQKAPQCVTRGPR